ncbi:MAG: proprotein convertase P-domain-containing protein [Vicinamibacterales bacterium]
MTATLIAPDGTSHVVFGRRGATTATGKGAGSDLAGPYEFSDQATLDFWAAVGSPVPAGHYRTVEAGGAGATGAQTLMNPVFANRGGNGTWTLRFVDGWQGDTGTVSAASLTLTPVPFTSATPSTLGAIPDGPSNTCMTNGPPRIVEFPVSGKVGPVVSVAVSASLTHAFVGDVTATLVAPNGTTSHVLFGYTGATFQGSFGDDSDLSGIYTFLDASLGNWWTAAAAVSSVTPIPSGELPHARRSGIRRDRRIDLDEPGVRGHRAQRHMAPATDGRLQ